VRRQQIELRCPVCENRFRVPSEMVDRSGQGWIVQAATQQRDTPREWFDGPASRGARSKDVPQR